jgi:hypothetical protein
LKIIHEDCDPSLAEDKSLPTSSFLVEYVIGKDIHYDIVMAAKQVEIFDYYWDKYREDLLTFNQTQGRISPKLWGYKAPEGKKKKKDD